MNRTTRAVITTNEIPPYHIFFNPILKALRELGGSGSIEEINTKATESLNFSNEALEKLHDSEVGNESEIEYRLAWARTYLKQYGLINNSKRGVWALTEKAGKASDVDPNAIVRFVRARKKSKGRQDKENGKEEPDTEGEMGEAQPWRVQLYRLLTKELNPAAFERLVQRLLRESGFVQVEVTGRTGDGGIDGKGIAKIHGLMSFHVVFQCKRYQGVVTAGEIRNFRGAMIGRSDKGLFITTGSFTRDAIKEATRDGAPPIDLIDGELLAEKLKELGLGVRVEAVERVTIEPSWFTTI